MTFKFKLNLLRNSFLLTMLLTGTLGQAQFFGEKVAAPLPKELGALRQAYIFSDKAFSPAQVEKELVQELDQTIGETWWAKNKDKMAAGNKDDKADKVKEYLEALGPDELGKMRDEVFKNDNKYTQSGNGGATLRSFEVWKRSQQKAQDALMKVMKLDANDVQRGKKTSYKLDKDHVPYGGNFFPDNLGGIARRWNNGDYFMDEFFDYKTFHEKALKEVTKAADKKRLELKEKDPKGYAAFKEDCKKNHKDLSKTECYMKVNEAWTSDMAKARVIEMLKALSQEEINALSPTEKYDLANGYYDFRTTEFEKYYKGKRRKAISHDMPCSTTLMLTLYWEGRCNADRAAGICNRLNEPVHQLTVDLDEIGKKLVFEPLDTKALFMSTYFYVENFAMMGHRNQGRQRNNIIPPNMAALDILLRGAFTQNNFPFVIDNHNDASVNNVTVIGYDREVVSVKTIKNSDKRKLAARVEKALKNPNDENANDPKNFSDGKNAGNFQNEMELYKKLNEASKVMRIKTKLKLLSEAPVAEANGPTKKLIAEEGKFTTEEDIEYELYLNDNNEIVEGKYISGNIDFIWFADGAGTEEKQAEGNKLIKYEVMKDLATKAATGAQQVDRKIFAGQKKE